MEEKHVVIKSDFLFMDRHGHMKPDLKVSVKTEKQKWMLESKPKFSDGSPLEGGNHSHEEKYEEVIVPDKVKIDTPTEPEDQAASDDMDTDNLTEFKCFDAADQNNNAKRVNTDVHPVNKKAKCELIEDMIEEETAVLSASHEKQDNVAPEGAIGSEGDARSAVHLPTEAEELRTNQNFLKGKMCQVCGLVFESKPKRKKHQRTHPVGEKVHQCVSCDKWFQYLAQIAYHKCRPMHIVNPEKPHTVCSSGFAEVGELTLHQKHIGNQEKPYKCNIRGSGFAEMAVLAAHQDSEPHRHNCLVCGLVFVNQREKQEHQATHTLGLKIHQCGVCKKWFEYLPEFETHIFLHKPFREHMCTLCCAQFSEMEDLTAHLSIHPKLKCCICGARFVTKKEKRKHMASHVAVAGEKTHNCTLFNNRLGGTHNCTRCCGSFTVQEDLNAHMLTHRKKCHVCGLTFDTSGEREKHQAEHPAGEKTQHCTLCDKWFVTLKEIDIHILLKHMDILEKPHKCNVCGKAFLYPDALSVHKGKH